VAIGIVNKMDFVDFYNRNKWLNNSISHLVRNSKFPDELFTFWTAQTLSTYKTLSLLPLKNALRKLTYCTVLPLQSVRTKQ
jgi:hypothetical protein